VELVGRLTPMAAISIDQTRGWVVARWAFRRLLAVASTEVTSPEDVSELERAALQDGLILDFMPPDQRRRLVVALRAAAATVRADLAATPSSDPRQASYAEALVELDAMLAESETR
jgi:hypothetical protein